MNEVPSGAKFVGAKIKPPRSGDFALLRRVTVGSLRCGAARARLMRSAWRMTSDPPFHPSAPFTGAVVLAGGERRDGARRRVRLRTGRALDGNGRFLCEATIVDLSQRGARLRLADPAALPATLWLYDEAAGLAVEARVARRTAQEAGLALGAWKRLEELPAATRRRLEAPYYGAD